MILPDAMDSQIVGEALPIASAFSIPLEWAYRIVLAASAVGGNGMHLAKVINAESAFKLDAVNASSGATGLIQFMPKTAVRLGTTTAAIRRMTFDQQMTLVEAYLKEVASGRWVGGTPGPLDTQAKMALAVFYPALRDADPSAPLPAAVSAQNAPEGRPLLTIGDYVDFVVNRTRRVWRNKIAPAATIAAGGATMGASAALIGMGLGVLAFAAFGGGGRSRR